MIRTLASILTLASANSVFAHFIFLVPASGNTPARFVLGDQPAQDPQASAEFFPVKSVVVVDRDGRAGDGLKPTFDKASGAWSFAPGDDLGAVTQTSIDYGVVNRGEKERWLIRHHARLVRDTTLAEKAPLLPLDIRPLKTERGLSFLVQFKGKPAVNVDVFILDPEQAKPRVVKTDTQGVTPNFEVGRDLAVRVGVTDATPGEFEGRRYACVKHYATLVVAGR